MAESIESKALEDKVPLSPLDREVWNNALRYLIELEKADYFLSEIDKLLSELTMILQQSVPTFGVLKATEHSPPSAATHCLKKAAVLYKTGIKCFSTIQDNSAVQLYSRFLGFALGYPRFKDQMRMILKDIELNCKAEEERYETVVQLCFKKDQFEIGLSELEKGLMLLQTMKMYDIAVRVLNNLIKGENQPSTAIYYVFKLHGILFRGLEKNLLSEDSFLIWLELFSSNWHVHLMEDDNSSGIGTVAKDEEMFNAARIQVVSFAAERYPSNATFVILKNQMDANLPPETIYQTIC